MEDIVFQILAILMFLMAKIYILFFSTGDLFKRIAEFPVDIFSLGFILFVTSNFDQVPGEKFENTAMILFVIGMIICIGICKKNASEIGDDDDWAGIKSLKGLFGRMLTSYIISIISLFAVYWAPPIYGWFFEVPG
tara:strand:+ start:162 stop:569 length:408 start_codon:yes stop_codon:yes gene_type:complete